MNAIGPARPDGKVLLGVAVAMVAVSASAIFIRLADAPPLAVALWRNVLAVSVLAPVVAVRREELPRGRTLLLAVIAGVALALHFAAWITSLSHTSVAASVVLVCTQPIWVALLARAILKEHVGAAVLAGIVVAFIGCAVIALGADLAFEGALLGKGLALLGAATVAVYVLVGRSVRSSGVALLPYAVTVYSVAALVLLGACLATRTPLSGYPSSTWLWLLALAVGPQILGHTLMNWALRYLKAAVLSGTVLVEPVTSTLLAWLVLGEVPTSQTLLGGAVVLFGLGLLVVGRR